MVSPTLSRVSDRFAIFRARFGDRARVDLTQGVGLNGNGARPAVAAATAGASTALDRRAELQAQLEVIDLEADVAQALLRRNRFARADQQETEALRLWKLLARAGIAGLLVTWMADATVLTFQLTHMTAHTNIAVTSISSAVTSGLAGMSGWRAKQISDRGGVDAEDPDGHSEETPPN
jgi:hypothetical protein